MAIIYPEQKNAPSEYSKARQKLRLEKEAEQQIVNRLRAGGKISRAEFNRLDAHHKMSFARSGQIIQQD